MMTITISTSIPRFARCSHSRGWRSRRAPRRRKRQASFQIEEATIADVQNAIKSGQTTCQAVVQAYIERAKAYNGVCTALVTADGKPIPAATGAIRAGAPLTFPTQTVPISSVVPNYSEYSGLPLELGRMEPTISDPSVPQQWGMRVGIPNAGQLNALETLNIRGERSVTCKGDFDRHPSAGPLPAGAPKECEAFRKQPDALERAAELDKQYGKNPDLAKMPMYCTVISFKNWYDAKDMRGTGGNDVNFAMDVPKVDSPDIAELRAKGAIIYAVATADNVGGASSQTGPAKPKTNMPFGNLKYAQWGGQPCNPYDTTREPRGTSGGSGVSVSANLAACSICEQGSASCKGPASRNGVVNLLTTKGIIMDGGIGSKSPGDRAGIHCRTVPDAVAVLDAIKGYEKDDMFTSIPKLLIPKEPYASFLVGDKDVNNKPLKGVRVGIVREFMVKHTKNDVAISDQIDKEIKTVLRDKLGRGARRVGRSDVSGRSDRAEHEVHVPGRVRRDPAAHRAGVLLAEDARRRAGVRRARLGRDDRGLRGGAVDAQGAAVAEAHAAAHRASGSANPRSPYVINKYLAERGDARVKDWASWVANAKFENDEQRARRRERHRRSGPARGARQRQLSEDAVGAAHGDPQGDVRERHRRVRQPGADDRAVQAGIRGRARSERSAADQLLHGVHGAGRHAGDGRARRLHARSATTRSTCSRPTRRTTSR